MEVDLLAGLQKRVKLPNWAPVHNVCSVVVTPLESRGATSCGYNSSHPVWHALYECLQDIHGNSSPLQPFHELSNGFWPRLKSPRPTIQFVPKMFYRVEVGALGRPVQSANIVVGVPLHRAMVAERLACSPPAKANLDDTAGRRVFSGMFTFTCPFIPALLHSYLVQPSSALKTSFLRAVKISRLSTRHTRCLRVILLRGWGNLARARDLRYYVDRATRWLIGALVQWQKNGPCEVYESRRHKLDVSSTAKSLGLQQIAQVSRERGKEFATLWRVVGNHGSIRLESVPKKKIPQPANTNKLLAYFKSSWPFLGNMVYHPHLSLTLLKSDALERANLEREKYVRGEGRGAGAELRNGVDGVLKGTEKLEYLVGSPLPLCRDSRIKLLDGNYHKDAPLQPRLLLVAGWSCIAADLACRFSNISRRFCHHVPTYDVIVKCPSKAAPASPSREHGYDSAPYSLYGLISPMTWESAPLRRGIQSHTMEIAINATKKASKAARGIGFWTWITVERKCAVSTACYGKSLPRSQGVVNIQTSLEHGPPYPTPYDAVYPPPSYLTHHSESCRLPSSQLWLFWCSGQGHTASDINSAHVDKLQPLDQAPNTSMRTASSRTNIPQNHPDKRPRKLAWNRPRNLPSWHIHLVSHSKSSELKDGGNRRSRENPLTNGVVQHYSHLRKSVGAAHAHGAGEGEGRRRLATISMSNERSRLDLSIEATKPMRVNEVSMEQRRNESAGETGDSGNPPTNGIVQHDSHLRKSGVKRPGVEPVSSWWEARSLVAHRGWWDDDGEAVIPRLLMPKSQSVIAQFHGRMS
ncbi:hypothetical protein PR048_025189 [Dryococelus australis]|uniref:Uncharacterized protein n=1 Tax=Dryococelus australis TaxID=614101 RepID=A0ABQ9GQS0_9NEOP|nr:hypothetical protein PR048_025189 [Dryococelus australis]